MAAMFAGEGEAMADASALLQRAAQARARASHARDLARAVTDDHDAAALTALADELERRASELQQQAADAAPPRAPGPSPQPA